MPVLHTLARRCRDILDATCIRGAVSVCGGRYGLLKACPGFTLGLNHRRPVENPLEIGELQRRAVLSFDGFFDIGQPWPCGISVLADTGGNSMTSMMLRRLGIFFGLR